MIKMRVLFLYACTLVFCIRMEIQMQISLSDKFKTLPTVIVFAVLSILFSATSLLLLGELMLPFSVASLAILFVLESGRRRIFSIAIPVIAIAADLILHGVFSYLALETTVLAVIVVIFFLRGSKAECAFWLTLATSLFVVFAMVLVAYQGTGVLSLDSFINYYVGIYEMIEKTIVEVFEEAIATAGTSVDGVDVSIIPVLLSAIASLTPSIIIIFGFAVAGVSLKLFSRVLRFLCDDESRARISEWRFALPTPIYIAFWVAAVLNLFSGLLGTGGIFNIVVMNVYNVLLYVFLYVGFGVVVDFLTALFKKRSLAIVVTLAAIMFIASIAIELIAYFGASYLFFRRRDVDGQNL